MSTQVPFDSPFFDQLQQLLTLDPEAFAETTQGKIQEPTRSLLIRANEVELTRGKEQTFELMNTGSVPLRFKGNLIAEQEGPWHRGKKSNRYIDLRVYRTLGDTYVAEIVFCTSWNGESDRHIVSFGDLKSCVEKFKNWLPSKDLVGVGYPNPEQPQFKQRQARLMTGLDMLYEDRVTRILAALPSEHVAQVID